MSAFAMQAAPLPRFLHPQLSWSARAGRSPALSALEARRHQYSSAPKRCATTPIATAIQQQHTQRWPNRSQHATKHPSALESRRQFSATAPQLKDHHFDTLKFVQRLQDEGFTEEQAEGMMKVLGDVIEERCAPSSHSSLLGLTRAVSKTSHERWCSEKTRSERRTPKRLTSQSCAPNS
jgi:hypothetical protein